MTNDRMRPARTPRAPWRVCALVLAAGAIASALAGGVELPGTQPSDGSGDPRFPRFADGDRPGRFDPPSRCSVCHGRYRQPGQRMYEPYDSWSGSLMANAARDPLFWAALDVAADDDRRELGDIGIADLCLRCHVPRGWYEGRSDCDTPWGHRFDGSCLSGPPERRNNDFEGIACHFCHRQYDAGDPPPGQVHDPQAPYAGNGRIYLSDDRRTMRGPFSDAVPTGHPFDHSPFHDSAAFCGQCHDVTNPVRNRRDAATGEDLGFRMPIERTYTEWAQSDFARAGSPRAASCQTCHMPAPDFDGDGTRDFGFACNSPPGPRGFDTPLEGPMRSHVFRGANTFMLGVLRGEYGGVLKRDAAFTNAIEESLELLQRETARVEIGGPHVVRPGRDVSVRVRVTNLAGHKFPTGYPEGRRAWLELTAGPDRDGDGTLERDEIAFVSGRFDRDEARLIDDPQLRVYEYRLGVWDHHGSGACSEIDDAGGRAFHFVLDDCVLADTRIPPAGFRPTPETAPVGADYAPDPERPGALAHWDDVTYRLPLAAAAPGAPILVRARVMYQSVSREYVEFLVRAAESTCDPFDAGCDPTAPDERANRAEKFQALWEAYGRSEPVVVATARAVIDPRSARPLPDERLDRWPARWERLHGARPIPGRRGRTRIGGGD